ncbi:methyltransferase-like protein 2 [Impatiens glandulifera]|uniref:methyltransferase-like protein 2 n=1 Tax=Impatiens glandulifera TaxID=253017 RepID=UPI001FB11A4E|nr:methyltransferase-like protein 2 [Impatiens glandulifera]
MELVNDGSKRSERMSVFLKSGIYQFENCSTIFIDPVAVLNRSYTGHKVSPSAYYSRFFEHNHDVEEEDSKVSTISRKRKRKKKSPCGLNEREQRADERHKEARPHLLKAHEALLEANELVKVIPSMKNGCCLARCIDLPFPNVELSFVELGNVWQAPLYEMSLNFNQPTHSSTNEGLSKAEFCEQKVVPVFNSLVQNETSMDLEAEFLGSKYILPRKSCFYMSDLGKIHELAPDDHQCRFNLIVIDPPWENSSARQKMKYPTLPNRYLLSLPIKQLAHKKGAIVALWVTNREKLRDFVEKELFPSWGVVYITTLYWLKVKPDCSLIGDLDLFHHRPYECLLIGYCHGEAVDSELILSGLKNTMPHNQVMISVPGDYSRKPPVGEFLKNYLPDYENGIELFAREMIGGWTSWGNETLHFQESRYFQKVPTI